MGEIDTSQNPVMPIFYNVLFSVGSNCPNMRDDVKLVQYMLKKYYESAPAHVVRPAGRKIEVTGDFDSQTEYAIVWYQGQISMLDPGAVTFDSRIDRMLDKTNFKGSLSGTHYTLFWLHQNLKNMNPAAFIALPLHVPLHNSSNMPLMSIA
jgi:hypothetical protein